MSAGKQKRILVAVLDWGLGHATRSIPVIRCLMANDCQVAIAGSGASLALLRAEFPSLQFHELPSYRITYPTHEFFFLHLALQSPRIFRAIRKEHLAVERLVKENNYDAIVSDNRYGCYSQKTPSVFISHQLNIQVPWVLAWSKWMVDRINRYLINRFDCCWVPDFADRRLTGKLSFSHGLKVKFIGPLSRFSPAKEIVEEGLVVGLVSGPEPQREIFERLLINECKKLDQPCRLVLGLPQRDQQITTDMNLTLITHLNGEDLQALIAKAEIVISRSGYSTLMDLAVLGKKKIIFVPTPGQSEQEYLAAEMERKKVAYTQTQEKINLPAAIDALQNYHGFEAMSADANLPDNAIRDLFGRMNGYDLLD